MSHEQILVALLAEIEVFADVPEDALLGNDPYVRSMVTIGIPYSPATWFGEAVTPSQRMACSRAARRLATEGLVERILEGHRDRVTHLVPTTGGLRQALKIAGPDACSGAVMEGLQRTTWGRPLATVLSNREAHDRTVPE